MPDKDDKQQHVQVVNTEQEPKGEHYAIDRLSLAFETSARRWELIVYPTLFAFILLAAYGFYLVFSLAKDIHFLALSVDSNMNVMSSNLQTMTDSMGQLTANVRTMSVNIDSMSQDIRTLEPMLTSMDSIEDSIKRMTVTTQYMQHDMRYMNYTIDDASRPFSMWNSFMPW